MGKILKNSVVIVVMISILLIGCSSSLNSSNIDIDEINIDRSENAIRNLVVSSTTEVTTLIPQLTQESVNHDISTNIFDYLVYPDCNGKLCPCMASSWESDEDCKEWTFHLREDICWVDVNGNKMADVTSRDFALGMEWSVNQAKCGGVGTAVTCEFIEGAKEYYSYTMSLKTGEAKEIPLEKFLDMVGVEIPDDHTIIYHCVRSCSFFPSIYSNTCMIPIPNDLVKKIGVDGYNSATNKELWYCGPYILSEFISGNEKILDPNPLWWGNEEHTRFESVTIKILENQTLAYQLFRTGEIDETVVPQSGIKVMLDDPDNEYIHMLTSVKYPSTPYGLMLNFHKNFEDGSVDTNWNKAVANENFRLSLLWGADYRERLMAVNPLEPYSAQNFIFNTEGVGYFSDGTEYSQRVCEKLGYGLNSNDKLERFDLEKALEYKEKAMEELKKEGVTFPIEVDLYVAAGKQSAVDEARLIAQAFEGLGKDYLKFDINTCAKSVYTDAAKPGYTSFAESGWGPDYNDPSSTLGTIVFDDATAYYAVSMLGFEYMDVNDPNSFESVELYEELCTFRDMYYDACETVDTDERLEKFADAECYMIEHALGFIPDIKSVENGISNIDQNSKSKAVGLSISKRYVDYKTNKNGIGVR